MPQTTTTIVQGTKRSIAKKVLFRIYELETRAIVRAENGPRNLPSESSAKVEVEFHRKGQFLSRRVGNADKWPAQSRNMRGSCLEYRCEAVRECSRPSGQE